MIIRANKDTLGAIWVLAKLGWSSRRIARVKLPTSHHTITAYLAEAYELRETGDLPIYAMDEGAVRIRYCGDTRNIEDIEGMKNNSVCGGGRRVRPHIYNSELREMGNEE